MQIIGNGALEQLKNEVDIQTVCGHHPFIVQCVAFWQTHRQICIRECLIDSNTFCKPFLYSTHLSIPTVTEFVCGGELFASVEHFSLALVRLYVLEIAIALGIFGDCNCQTGVLMSLSLSCSPLAAPP